jgi:hypothetical protein
MVSSKGSIQKTHENNFISSFSDRNILNFNGRTWSDKPNGCKLFLYEKYRKIG